MVRLAFYLFFPTAITLAGSLVIAALAMGMTDTQPILVASVLGFALGVPASYFVAREITNRG
ncbi:MAG: CTP synthetase [Dinoroseobacter sp.]|nr:CTP synthetase [Dinoroseobacter sp.]MDJ0993674.1 CTP synthetase [Dinoroseobacter sp.]